MTELEKFRHEIDQIDCELLALLARRKNVVTQIGEYKKLHNMSVFDAKREDYLHDYYKKLSNKYDLSFEFVVKLFDMIITESRRIQTVK